MLFRSLESGLVGHWTFDGPDVDIGANQLTDGSGQGNTASTTGMDSATSTTFGVIGQAFELDGTDDYVGVPNGTFPTGDFTAAAWVYLDDNTDEMLFASLQNCCGSGQEFDMYISGADIRIATNGTTRLTTSDNWLTTGTWHHIVATRAGSNITLYTNAAVKDTGSDGGALNFQGCILLIGTDPDSGCTGSLGNYLDGTVDDVRIYNRALSKDEISRLYELGR